MQPKVSVIIPVYNAERYLRQCLDSVLNSTLKDIEVICVDDCSTDTSRDMLQEYSELHKNIILVFNDKNLMAGKCRNKGLELSSGEFVHFLDSDDYVENNAYELLYEVAHKNDLDILKAKAYDLDAKTNIITTSDYNSLKKVPDNYFDRKIRFLDNPSTFLKICVAPWGSLFKRNFLIENNIKFNDLMCVNDRSFYSETIFKAESIMFSDVFLVNYRINNGSSLVGNRGKYFECHFRSYDIINDLVKEQPMSVRKQYMENELHDIAFWFKKFSNSEYAEEISNKVDDFLDTFDKTIWNNDVTQKSWYKNMLNVKKHIEDNKIKISVVTPCFNSSKYLTECIESLLNQTFKQAEFIFVDDGSTDDSVKILEEYQKKDNRIKIIRQQNLYAGVARNNGIKHSKGKYITFLDSDDIMLKDALENFYTKAESTGADIVISSAYHFSNNINDKKIANWILRKEYLPREEVFSLKDCADYIFQISAGVVWGRMFRTDFIKNNDLKFPDTPCSEDFYFLYLSYVLANKITVLNKYSVLYRNNISSDSLEHTKDKYPAMYIRVRRLLWERLNELNLYKSVERSFVNTVISSAFYYFDTCKSRETFEITYKKFKDEITFYNIDIYNESYFYFKGEYLFARELYDSKDAFEYVYMKYLKYRESMKVVESIKRNVQNRIGDRSMKQKILNGIKCYRQHGFKYTFKRLLYHLGLSEENNKITKKSMIKKDYDFYVKLDPKEYGNELKLWYKSKTGKELDLNNPKTFNEKIQWLKLYDSTPLKTQLADKYLVRDWVKEKIGEQYLIPLLGVYDRFDEIDFDKLPNQFVLKANHGSGWNIVVKDKNYFDVVEAERNSNIWLKSNYAFKAGFELHYLNIVPKIVIEEYHPCRYEYQFWCFDGRPEFVSVIQNPHGENIKASYDINWNRLDFVTSKPMMQEKLPAPSSLDKMTQFARLLSAQFAFVRVDFLCDDKKIYVGELTFTPATGIVAWHPSDYDLLMGSKLVLPKKSFIIKNNN